MRKLVVLGANAFSGQDFIDLALNDPSLAVIGISRSPEKPSQFLSFKQRADLSRYRFLQIDMNSQMSDLLSLLDDERPQWIVNFAAQSEVGPSWDFPEHWFQTNTVALAQLVNHLRKQIYLERYLHISSPEAYGSCRGTVTEDTPDSPSTPYAASKAAADMLLQAYHRQFGFPLLTVRATNVYGARQQLFKIIPRTAIYLKMGKRIELHGGGQAVKSYIHVRDVSIGEMSVLTHGKIGRRYHLSPEGGVSVRDIVARMCKMMNTSLENATTNVGERPGQDAAYVIDSTLARNELSWNPTWSLDAGLAEVINWVEENWKTLSALPLDYQHQP